MTYDTSPEAAVREYLAGAERAITRGDVVSACREIITALSWAYSIVSGSNPSGSDQYKQDWEEVAFQLARLNPSLVRHAMRIIDGR